MTVSFPPIGDRLRAERLEPPTGPVRVVLDTDAANEIDDQYTLAWALLRPYAITLEAVVAEPYSFAHHRAPLAEAAEAAPASGTGMAPWIDTAECTSCDECIKINPQIFAYDENDKAYIKDAAGGPFRDLVKAAERCTAQVIHPGLPRDPSEKDAEKWIRRAEKYN